MASSSKKKTTFAKLAREQKLRERRQAKQAKKDARRNNAVTDPASTEGAAASAVSPEDPSLTQESV